jgi:hypothetical protein
MDETGTWSHARLVRSSSPGDVFPDLEAEAEAEAELFPGFGRDIFR